jgi:hypothetical protein
MSLISDALLPKLVGRLLSVNGRQSTFSLSDVITSNKAAYLLGFDTTAQTVTLDFRDSEFISSATASDCSRLSISSLQTILQIKDTFSEKANLPWSLIQLYYSAFYAGHTVIRMLGDGCCWLDGLHVSKIDAVANAMGSATPFKLQTGAYRCEIESGATRLTWSKLSGGAKGGAHEAFWHFFDEKIRLLAEGVLAGPMADSESQKVFAQLDALRALGRKYGATTWLSHTRNELQYRMAHEVWYPSSFQKRDLEALGRLVSQWDSDPMDIDLTAGFAKFGRIGDFAVACTFTVSLCRALILRAKERSDSTSKCFLNMGPIAYLNTTKSTVT